MDLVTKYAQQVVSGEEITGRYVLLACQRHLENLEASKNENYPYYFDIEEANKSIKFFESLKFTDGDLRGQPIKLLGFQNFIVGSLFGWKNKETQYRRFKKSYVQLARKNTKSLLNSGIGIKLAAFDNYPLAQVYCTAVKMQQARIVWEQARNFIEIEKDLNKLFKIKNHDSILECLHNKSTIRALGRDIHSIDGFNVHGGIVDEFHSHKNNQMVKLLEDGSVTQSQPLISIITTAGFNLNGPCYQEWEYCCNILNKTVDNEEYFIYIAQLDKDDDIWDSKNWIKANPLASTLPEGMKNLKRFAKEAKDKGGEDLRNFLTKSLNIWYSFEQDQYIEAKYLNKCECNKTLEDFTGQKCYIGLDLSSGGDLTSLAMIFIYYENDEKKYFIHSHSFIPSKRVEDHIKSDKAPYDVWINENLLTVTETLGGFKTDYKYIITYLKDLVEKYDLKIEQLGYDPHNSDTFLQDLEELGCDCIEIYQAPKWLNDPTEDFRLEVMADNIQYNKDNKLLKWSILNAKTVSNANGEIKIDKNKKSMRIDAVDAVIDAYKLVFNTKNLNYKIDINKYSSKEFLSKLWE